MRKSFPHTLTKQQRTLVSLARALAGSPMILLLDEPLEDLDNEHRSLALSAIQNCLKNITTIVFSREASLVSELQARFVRLENGRVQEEERTESPSPLSSHNIFTRFTIPFIKDREETETEKTLPVKKVRVVAIHSQ